MHSPRPLNQSTQCLFRPDGEHANFTEDPKTQTHEQTTHKPPHTPSPHSPYTPLTPPLPPRCVLCGQVVVALAEARANLEDVDSDGWTALIIAAQEGHDKARAHSGHTHNHWAKGGHGHAKGGCCSPALEREGRGRGFVLGRWASFCEGSAVDLSGPSVRLWAEGQSCGAHNFTDLYPILIK